VKKSVSPVAAIVVIVIVVVIAAFLFVKKAQTQKTAAMSRGGITIEDGKRVKPPADRGAGRRGGGGRR
jgi:hypothetical protein